MRLIIYGPELLFNEAMAYLFVKRRHTIVACPTTVKELADLADYSGIEVALVELSSELDATRIREVRQLLGAMPVVAMTAEMDTTLAQLAVSAGADGICLKSDGIEEIESVVARTVVHRTGTSRIVWSRRARILSSGTRTAPDGTRLTARESAVLDLLMRGESTGSIAHELGVSDATIRTHLQHLFGKFGVHTRIALVAAAARTAPPAAGTETMGMVS